VSLPACCSVVCVCYPTLRGVILCEVCFVVCGNAGGFPVVWQHACLRVSNNTSTVRHGADESW
jgi:hypothetical protein